MKPLPSLPILLLALIVLAPSATLTAAPQRATLEVILVEASGNPGGVDNALRDYASTLQRLFRFQSYRRARKVNLQIEVPGKAETGLARGQMLRIESSGAARGTLGAELDWRDGSTRLLHTRLNLRPNTPAVLGGPPSSDANGSWLLIVQWRE